MLKLLVSIDINKINWTHLSKNPNEIKLLKQNQNKSDILKNPNIFTYDYKTIKENMKNSGIAEELTT